MTTNTTIQVVVGSENPLKLRSVRKAFRRFFPRCRIRGEAVAGAPHGPAGWKAVKAGARMRAQAVAKGADFAVGIEAGLVPDPAEPRWMICTLCAILHRRRLVYGWGPAFEIPARREWGRVGTEKFRNHLRAWTGEQERQRGKGFVGVITGGRVTRAEVTTQAVLMALVAAMSNDE